MLSLVIFFSPPAPLILSFLSVAYWISALAFPLCLIDGRSSAQVPRESTPLKRKKIERSACQETVEALVAFVGTLCREISFFSPSSALARRREIESGAGGIEEFAGWIASASRNVVQPLLNTFGKVT